LSIPLGLFFTSHPSKYFPIAAIAGCNDIRVSIKFRPVKEVLMQKGTFTQNAAPNHGPVYRNPETGVAYRAIQLHVDDLASALADVTTSAEWTINVARLVIAPGTVTFSSTTSVDASYAVFEFKTVYTATSPRYRIVSVTQTAPGNIADLTTTTYAYFTGARTSTNPYGTYDSTTGPTRWQKGVSTTVNMRIQYNTGSGSVTNVAPRNDAADPPQPSGGNWFKRCQLRCHYIHVTGPEATSLMNKEHVRLMKLMDDTNHLTRQFRIKCSTRGTNQKLALDLNFLHPVQEIIITIRKIAEMGSDVTNSVAPGTGDGLLQLSPGGIKNYFAYHGGGRDPNFENYTISVDTLDPVAQVRQPTYLRTTAFQLKLNGQSRHLDGQGISRDYLMNRLMPMIHSAAREDFVQVSQHSSLQEFEMLSELMDRKEIYVYPFALNPEGANPSGSVNFSKVSHARLEIDVDGFAPGLSSATETVEDDYLVDVYGVYFNWLAIKDGRALTSFA
jgi:hypothetical protein